MKTDPDAYADNMTIRERMALELLCARWATESPVYGPRDAVRAADALIAALNEEPGR